MSSQVFTTIGTTVWNWPAGVTSVTAEALGGGGGGGTASGNPSTGGGGRGGAYARIVINKGAEASLSVIIAAIAIAAATGGDSKVTQGGTDVLVAGGGGGGATASVNSTNGTGGISNNPSSAAATVRSGGSGGTGAFAAGSLSGAGGGAGGPSSAGGVATAGTAGMAGTGTFLNGVAYQSAGRAGVGDSTPGIAGLAYGGGGSGGKANNNTDRVGGTGSQGIVVLTWSDPPTTLQRVQATGKQRIQNSTSPLTMTFGSLPTVGNGIIVEVWGSDAQGGGTPFNFADGMVTDNQGNNYDLAVNQRNTTSTSMASAVFYCPKVITSSGTFTITLNSGLGHVHWFLGAAVEIGGLGTGQLAVSSFSSQSNVSGATHAAGLAGLTNGEALVATVMCLTNVVNETSITVQTVFPNYREEAEELGGAIWMNGEANTRIVNFTPADYPGCQWSIAPNAGGAAVIAVFQVAAPPGPIGSLSQTLASTTTAADSDVETHGTLARTLPATTPTASATIETIAALSRTTASATLSATAASIGEVKGALAITLPSSVPTAAVVVPVVATASPTLAPATVVATAGVLAVRTANLSQTTAPATAASTVSVLAVRTATVSQTLAAATVTAATTSESHAVLGRLLDASTVLADTRTVAGAVLSQTLGAATVAAPVDVGVTGSLSQTLATTTLGADAVVVPVRTATLSMALAPASALSTGQVFPIGQTGVNIILANASVVSATKIGVGTFFPGEYGTGGNPYRNAVIADGASNYWRLGELSGNTTDLIGAKHGVLSGGGITRGVSGPVGDASMFFNMGNGGNGKIITSGPVVLGQTYTLEAWVWPTASAQRPVFSGRPTLGAPYYGTTTGPKQFVFIGASIQGLNNLPLNAWSHVVAIFDPLAITFYTNGVFDGGPFTIAARATANVTAPGIGFDQSNIAHWIGGLDDVAVYPLALTPTKIAEHFALRAPIALAAATLSSIGNMRQPIVMIA